MLTFVPIPSAPFDFGLAGGSPLEGWSITNKDATRNKCIASSNKCLTTSNKDATRLEAIAIRLEAITSSKKGITSSKVPY